ncbi:MAG: hypothetical protein WC426_02585 [Sulfuriferula sp.]
MAVLNKDQILAAQDLQRETVAVPEWGGEVIIQALSAEQSEALVKSNNNNSDNFAVALLALSLVDESGTPLFTTDSINELKKKSATVISALVKLCTKMNGLDKESAAKNAVPSDSVTSESPLP